MTEYPKMMREDIGFNDPITITLPAHVWHGFMSAYSASEWHSADADIISREAINLLVDPVLLKEKEARDSEQHDVVQSFIRAMATGQPQEMPPHIEGEGEGA
jgi:hypothetical protein